MIITGVIGSDQFDTTRCGKLGAVELYAASDIPDLSFYGLGVANGGEGSDGKEFTFPADEAAAGTFIYVALDGSTFQRYFGIESNYTNSTIDPQGGDAVELFRGDSAYDVFGDVNTNGTGQAWDYTDGWAYSRPGRTASTTFNEEDWMYNRTKSINKRMEDYTNYVRNQIQWHF